jgi:hypothetical protein
MASTTNVISGIATENLPLKVLSFVRDKKQLWAPERTGDYAADCATGRFYAEELVEFIAATDKPFVLGHIAKAIAEAGTWDAVEIGFYSVLGAALARG